MRIKLSKRLFKYLVVGGSIYVLELAVIIGAQSAGLKAYAAVSVGYWVGLLLSFFLQKTVTFNDRRFHKKLVLSQSLAYAALVIFNYGFTLVLTRALKDHLALVAIRTIAIAITTIWNFYLYKTHIFDRDELVIS